MRTIREVFATFIVETDASWLAFKADPQTFLDQFHDRHRVDGAIMHVIRQKAAQANGAPSKPEAMSILQQLMLHNKKNKGRKMRRSTADRLYAGLLDRIKEINKNPTYGCDVPLVVLFGSYLNPQIEAVGDIDVAFIQTRRKNYESRNEELNDILPWRDFFTSLCRADQEVEKAMQNRSSWISLHPWSDFSGLNCPFRVIYAKGGYKKLTSLHKNKALTDEEFFKAVEKLCKRKKQ